MMAIFHNKEVIIVNDKVKYFIEGFTLGAKPVVKNIEVNNVNNQQLNVTENGTYTPDEGYTGFDKVVVNVEGGGGGEGPNPPDPGPDPFPNMAVNAFQYTVALKAFVLESKLMRAATETKTFVLTSKLFKIEEVV